MSITLDFTAQSSGKLEGKGSNTDIQVAGTPAVLNEPGEATGVCVVRIAVNGAGRRWRSRRPC
ncbi:hypothetical protein ACFQV2_01610 [Actinokineospora soli]|uniref:Uncharacterized protein n=1 Tax=Actinokineospora soli TaxID=1048753 RepID=A0ABW2TFL7_9PSEU